MLLQYLVFSFVRLLLGYTTCRCRGAGCARRCCAPHKPYSVAVAAGGGLMVELVDAGGLDMGDAASTAVH